ncbi:MAG: hypothetical protein M3Z14_01170 [Candidatus Eremiobacteraeota bacterium]|nr:hypothetical protein [Candidatus Eremiobacteraeota bacterium]
MLNLRTGWAGALFLVIVVFATSRLALAASTLSGITVQAAAGGATRVTLTFVGGVPRYQILGKGTTEISISLPETGKSAAVPLANVGVGSVTGYTVSTGASNLTQVVLHLVAPVTLTETVVGGRLVLAAGTASTGTLNPQPGGTEPAVASPIPGLSPGQNMQVVLLKYADVSEVVGILVAGQTLPPNDVFAATGSIFSLPTSAGGQGIPTTTNQQFNNGVNNQPQSFGQRINDNIAIDRRLNAVILSGTPQEIATLRAVIDKIDVPQMSVILECQVFELSETAARDVGLELTGNTGSLVSGQASAKTSELPTFSASLPQAAIFAQIRRGAGRILASPRILALNGSPATILSGDALPIVTTTFFPGTPSSQQTSVNYIAVGVNLQILPRIAEDGYVTSHIFAEVSSVTAFIATAAGQVPQISLRQATTTATVKDGNAFVIGGLLQDDEIRNMSKIPILGNLPLIGGLFRSRHDTATKTSLYILITPRIMHQLGQPNPATPNPQPRVVPTPNSNFTPTPIPTP